MYEVFEKNGILGKHVQKALGVKLEVCSSRLNQNYLWGDKFPPMAQELTQDMFKKMRTCSSEVWRENIAIQT